MLDDLLKNLHDQPGAEYTEVLTDDRGREITTGEKRNNLIESANGTYTVFLDDDDEVHPHYIALIVDQIGAHPDVITFNGWMTNNGIHQADWEIRLGHPYINRPTPEGKDYYLRWPNHLVPMRRELIKDFKFQHVTLGEDFEWSKRIHESGVLKTEIVIPEKMYHYKFTTK